MSKKRKKKKHSGGKKRVVRQEPEVDPAVLEAYYNDPIALWQDEEYEALDRLWRKQYPGPPRNMCEPGEEDPEKYLDENGDIPF
ncbi:MAG: hypothetical protein R6V12_14050 [Candidatus Hydrogenedentota bacterium]